MTWIVLFVIGVIVFIAGIYFLNKFYRKASRAVALVRTGAGGQKIILDGGCFSLPILHRTSEVNMRTSRLEVSRIGNRSMITLDRLRVDAEVEFYVRVKSTPEGVATAAQALGGKSFRAEELAETLEGKLVDAMLSVAANYTMDSLQDERGKYVKEVSDSLTENLALNGLALESVSLTRLDQTPFGALEENNAFNALGMRRLAEIVATNRKERAAIEADAEVAVRQSQLDATKRRLIIEREEQEAEIERELHVETIKASSQAEIAEQQATADERREQARINREREVRVMEIKRDREIRKLDLDANLGTEVARHDKEIQLAAKVAEEAEARAISLVARASEVAAEEKVNTARETAMADREKQLALIRAEEQAEVDDTRVKSETGTIRAMADAQADASAKRSAARKDEMLAEAEGTSALIDAENTRRDELVEMKVDLARIDALPEVVANMVKPAEKIDSIRINHFAGFGTTGDGAGGAGSGSSDKAVVNQMVDGILGLALQLPAAQKLGEEVGINIAGGIKGIGDALIKEGDSGETNNDKEPATDKES
jgi:flotillin